MSTFDETAYNIDVGLLHRVCTKSVDSYRAQVPDVIADRLFDRLTLLNTRPERVLDLGTGNGRHLRMLQDRYPKATIIGADICLPLLKRSIERKFWQRKPPVVCLDANRPLPFADSSFDLVVSNLMLPWIHPPDVLAVELNRILSVGGAFFISSSGPDTLVELREAWSGIDNAVHINAMLDMHDLGDVLLRAGLADPVVDTERLQVTYESCGNLLDELAVSGAVNVLAGRRRGLMSSDIRRQLAAAYPTLPNGGVAATLEVVYAHGWKGQRTAGRATGDYVISVDSLKSSLPGR